MMMIIYSRQTEKRKVKLKRFMGMERLLSQLQVSLLNIQAKGLCSRKYSCEKCPYTTAIKLNFRRHIRLHTHHQG